MGMYSHTDYCDLKIKKGKKKAFLKWLNKHNNWNDWKDITEIKGDEVYFNVKGWKIIGYWYSNFLKELEELNEFIEGEWGLAFETPEEYAIIRFTKSGVIVESGVMKWETYTIEDLKKMVEELEKAFG